MAEGSLAWGQVLPEGWPVRRALGVKVIGNDAPGENVAYAEFYANGLQKGDGSDVRVTTSDRMQVPMRLLWASPEGDLIRVAFQVKDRESNYYVWWGNGKPEKAALPMEIKKGIFCEVFRHPGGPSETEGQMQKLFEKAKAPEGAFFVPGIALGYNPLGPEWDVVFRYTTQFKVEKDTTNDIAFSIEKAGYVIIDGKLVLAHRGSVWDARLHKRVDLKAGWHTLEVAQVNEGGNTHVSLAWKGPGEREFSYIPANLFAPVVYATVGPTEVIGKPFTPDFNVEPMAESFVPPDVYVSRWDFDTNFPANMNLKGAGLTWTFGDGQSSRDKSAGHYFLTPGTYPVTLTVTNNNVTTSTTHRVMVQDRLYAKFPTPMEDGFRAFQGIVDRYEAGKLNADQRLRVLQYYQAHNTLDAIAMWGPAWAEAKEAQGDGVVWDTAFAVGRTLEARKDFKEAARVFGLVVQKPIMWDTRMTAMRYEVMELCDNLDDGEGGGGAAALKIAQEWKDNPNVQGKGLQHSILATMAYAAIAKGDGKLAGKLCEEAGTRRVQPFNQQEINQGVFTRNVEAAIRGRDFELASKTLNQWENDYPEAIMDGFTRMQRYKLLVAEGRPLSAARVAIQHAKAVPGSFYAAELLYRAAQSLTGAGKTDEAKVISELLKAKYPESPYANDKAKPLE